MKEVDVKYHHNQTIGSLIRYTHVLYIDEYPRLNEVFETRGRLLEQTRPDHWPAFFNTKKYKRRREVLAKVEENFRHHLRKIIGPGGYYSIRPAEPAGPAILYTEYQIDVSWSKEES